MQGSVLATANTNNILDANNFQFFWISWKGGVISVGQGNIVGNMTFLTYTDVTPSDVNYIAFTGWDAPGSVYISYGWYLNVSLYGMSSVA